MGKPSGISGYHCIIGEVVNISRFTSHANFSFSSGDSNSGARMNVTGYRLHISNSTIRNNIAAIRIGIKSNVISSENISFYSTEFTSFQVHH